MRLLKLSCLAILLIAITSCNKTNEKMMELIPENSTFVASFSPSKILITQASLLMTTANYNCPAH